MAQLVEYNLAKVGVAGSNPVSRLERNRKPYLKGRMLSVFSICKELYSVIFNYNLEENHESIS